MADEMAKERINELTVYFSSEKVRGESWKFEGTNSTGE